LERTRRGVVVKEEALTSRDFYKVLGHKDRRLIIQLLHENVEMSYTDLLRATGMDEGRFNFHFRHIKRLTYLTDDGKYILNLQGRRIYALMTFVEKDLEYSGVLSPQPILNIDIIGRRIAAFLIDGVIFFIFTGLIFDTFLWNTVAEFAVHFQELMVGHPWLFHLEHFPHIAELAIRTVSVYAHIFFAVFTAATLLDSYKGQTPGKYLLGIRVVTVSSRRLSLAEAGVRNIGKVFLLPLDLAVGILFYARHGYIKFFDYYTNSKVERVRAEISRESRT